MTSDEPEFTNWQDAWEYYARAEHADLRSRQADELLDLVRAGRFGGYYTLWDAIAERATLEQAAWTLMAVLESNADYLDRYHCAEALLRLMGSTRWEPVQLSASWPSLPASLDALRAELARRVERHSEEQRI